MSLRLDTNIFTVGSPIEALVVIRNVSDTRVFAGKYVREFDWEFQIAHERGRALPLSRQGMRIVKGYAWNSDTTNGPPIERPYYDNPRSLPSGWQGYFLIDLTRVCDLSEPGRYIATVSQRLRREENRLAEVLSNTEFFEIVPSSAPAIPGSTVSATAQEAGSPQPSQARSDATSVDAGQSLPALKPAGSKLTREATALSGAASNERVGSSALTMKELPAASGKEVIATADVGGSRWGWAKSVPVLLAMLPGAFVAWWLLRRRQR